MPTIIAHRGTPREHPENTLPAFARALELGADGLELDVHATRDGHVVVHHDAELPSSAAPALAGRAIESLTHAELRAHRVQGVAPVPLLADVLDAAAGRATVYVEIKARAIEPLVDRVLAGSRCSAEVHSFDHRVARRSRELRPALRVGVLSTSYLIDNVAAMRAAGATTLWQHWSMIDAELVAEVHAAGGAVIAWTVNAVAVACALAEIGVDGLCTDVPAEIRAALAREPEPPATRA